MAETPTQAGLAGLASQMPVRNKLVADQQRAGRLLQLQQAVSQMTPQQAPTAQQASGLGAQMAATAGAQQVQRAQETMQQVGQLAKLGQAETEQAASQRIAALTAGAQKEQMDQAARLAALDDKVKREVFDNELQFKKDQANATMFSERQLADYKLVNAQRDQDYANWAQKAKQTHDRSIAVLQTISARLEEVIRNDFKIGEQKLDQKSALEIAQLKRDNDRRLARAKARAQNTAVMWGAGGAVLTAAGTAAMFVPGGQVAGAGLIATGAAVSAYGAQQSAKEQGEV